VSHQGTIKSTNYELTLLVLLILPGRGMVLVFMAEICRYF